jgi:putative transposase
VKTVSATLGVARSNVVERRDHQRPWRGPQERAGDAELAGAIRRLVDARPTYMGTRGSQHSSSASGRAGGQTLVNAKRIYPLMKKHGLLLERHTGRRRPREHGGQVTTIRSNCRWCSDALEFTCWNGELVRLAFALDCHDREAISWVATTAGISGEMIRDMMVRCVEQRFDTIRAPHPVQWLSDTGSIFAAHKTIEIALALNLAPCFTPVESPESNGMAEAFVKTLKRDYVRISSIPDAAAALALIDNWMERTTTPCIPIAGWAIAHPGSTSCPNPLRARFNRVNSRLLQRWRTDRRSVA